MARVKKQASPHLSIHVYFCVHILTVAQLVQESEHPVPVWSGATLGVTTTDLFIKTLRELLTLGVLLDYGSPEPASRLGWSATGTVLTGTVLQSVGGCCNNAHSLFRITFPSPLAMTKIVSRYCPGPPGRQN